MKLSFSSSSSTLDFSLPLFYTFPSHTVPSRETDIIRTSGVISKSIEETEKREKRSRRRGRRTMIPQFYRGSSNRSSSTSHRQDAASSGGGGAETCNRAPPPTTTLSSPYEIYVWKYSREHYACRISRPAAGGPPSDDTS